MVPPNTFFQIPEQTSSFGTVNMLFDELRPEGDKTMLKKVAFKYAKNKNSGVNYLFLVGMTNKCMRRSKETPFMFEFILKCSATSEREPDDFEGD